MGLSQSHRAIIWDESRGRIAFLMSGGGKVEWTLVVCGGRVCRGRICSAVAIRVNPLGLLGTCLALPRPVSDVTHGEHKEATD